MSPGPAIGTANRPRLRDHDIGYHDIGYHNDRMDGSNLMQAARSSASFLGSAADRDWTTPIPGMDWSVAVAVAHISETLLWYATDLSAGPRELSTMDLRVRPESATADLVATVEAFSTALAQVVDGVPPGQRGWHPDGRADASGFAAMGCDELLVHTWDAGRGLGLDFRPPSALSDMVLRRLFPWAPEDTEPWPTLLWANGRVELDGWPRQTEWRWHCAPLSEWDGQTHGVSRPTPGL
jgi:uncharacterized protein (TIGR03083 family)